MPVRKPNGIRDPICVEREIEAVSERPTHVMTITRCNNEVAKGADSQFRSQFTVLLASHSVTEYTKTQRLFDKNAIFVLFSNATNV